MPIPPDFEVQLKLIQATMICAWSFEAVARRNVHYGHSHVDLEVAELRALIDRGLGDHGLTVSIGGAEFLSAIFCPRETALELIRETHTSFLRREPIERPQIIHGLVRGKVVYLRHPRTGYLTRAVHVVYDSLEGTPEEQRAGKLMQLLDLCFGFNPAKPVAYEHRRAMLAAPWAEEEWPIPEVIPSPCCEATTLDVKWMDDWGNAKASCRACGTEFGLPGWRRGA